MNRLLKCEMVKLAQSRPLRLAALLMLALCSWLATFFRKRISNSPAGFPD